MKSLGIDSISVYHMNDFSDKTIELLEYILNMVQLCENIIVAHVFSWTGKYELLKDNIDILLEQFGFTSYVIESEEKVCIIEKNPAVISAAEISNPETAKNIIQYNHYTLKGNIETKKNIILSLGNELEPQRTDLKKMNSELESDLFFMLNNINLRHNNKDPNNTKHYNRYIENMDDDEIENWYDEVYQMTLLAKLLLDNNKRHNEIKKLKTNF
jgi:phage-related protein